MSPTSADAEVRARRGHPLLGSPARRFAALAVVGVGIVVALGFGLFGEAGALAVAGGVLFFAVSATVAGWQLRRQSPHPRLGAANIVTLLALSAGTTAAILAAFAFSALAVGLSLPLVAVVTLVPLILLTMLIPVTISGWGLREGAAVAMLPIAGATASESLAASVAFGLIGLVAVLPGAAVVWLRSRARG